MLTDVPTIPTRQQLLADVLACPVCRGAVAARLGRVLCASCGRTYPIRDGVPDLLAAPPSDGLDVPPGLIGNALGAIVSFPVVYDLVQRLTGAEKTLARLRKILEFPLS